MLIVGKSKKKEALFPYFSQCLKTTSNFWRGSVFKLLNTLPISRAYAVVKCSGKCLRKAGDIFIKTGHIEYLLPVTFEDTYNIFSLTKWVTKTIHPSGRGPQFPCQISQPVAVPPVTEFTCPCNRGLEQERFKKFLSQREIEVRCFFFPLKTDRW